MSNPNYQVNGSVVYYLRCIKAIQLEPGELLSVEMSGITIDTTGGTRETSVEVAYDNLAYVVEPSSLVIGSLGINSTVPLMKAECEFPDASGKLVPSSTLWKGR